tara:strand:- start:198 stop:680 length:483 start_codon:yes stop_codon:yes gene_type:complete
MNRENFLRNQIKRILIEGESPEPEPKKKEIRKGSVGRGRVKDKVKEAKALASKDPQKLMDNLNIKSAGGNTTQDKVLNLVRNAIYGTQIMARAYTGARLIEDNESGEKYIAVTPGDLGVRDATLYMLHTITGADNAGILGSIDYDIEVSVKGGIVAIEFM